MMLSLPSLESPHWRLDHPLIQLNWIRWTVCIEHAKIYFCFVDRQWEEKKRHIWSFFFFSFRFSVGYSSSKCVRIDPFRRSRRIQTAFAMERETHRRTSEFDRRTTAEQSRSVRRVLRAEHSRSSLLSSQNTNIFSNALSPFDFDVCWTTPRASS